MVSCPYCGGFLAPTDYRANNLQGIIALHVKKQHPELWEGDMQKTLALHRPTKESFKQCVLCGKAIPPESSIEIHLSEAHDIDHFEGKPDRFYKTIHPHEAYVR